MELLAPAGSFDALKAAVENGRTQFIWRKIIQCQSLGGKLLPLKSRERSGLLSYIAG